MSEEPTQPEPVDEQLTIDAADTAAGYRTVLAAEDVADLAPGDPNLAVCTGDDPPAPAAVTGDEVDDDHGVAAALAQLAGGGDD